MKISIQSIALKNFKGIKNYVVLFDGEDTKSMARTFQEKQRLPDAWTWLLVWEERPVGNSI